MTETSIPWDGTSTGDASASPIDAATEQAAIYEGLAGTLALAGRGGVIRDARNELGCTPGSGKVTIDTGEALAYGTKYVNDAALDITIPTPSSSTRVDRIVLRKSWSAQTVRLTRIAGVEGAGAPALGAGTPAYTQTAGTTWDVPLYRVSVTTGGTISVSATGGVDDRAYVPVHGDQSSEIGTKHAWTNISGRPAPVGTVTTVVPGAAGTAGVSTDFSAGDHQHPLAADPQATSLNAILAGTGGITDPDLVAPILQAGTYHYTFMGSFQNNSSTAFGVAVGFSGTVVTNHYVAVGPGTVDWTQAMTLFDVSGPFGNADAGAADMGVIIEGYITVSTTGNLTVSYSGVGGNVYRIAGAMLHARRLY